MCFRPFAFREPFPRHRLAFAGRHFYHGRTSMERRVPAEFYHTPDNPAPANGIVDMITMRDGKRLRYARFAAEGRPLKGTVMIITGRNECIEKYFETIRDLSARGFGVAIFDLRGQGGSDRLIRDPRRGYIVDFADYVADIEPFIEQVLLPDCRGPYYVLAHSTGGLIALMASPMLVNRIRRMVICAPLLTLRDMPISMKSVLRLSSLMCAFGMGSAYITKGTQPNMPVPFVSNKLTSDYQRYTRNTELYRRHPHLGMGGPTAAWLRAACLAMQEVSEPSFRARLTIPTLFVAAGSDEVVSTSAVEEYGRRLRAGSVITIDGAKHEILQEADIFRQQFLAAFDAFVPGTENELSLSP
jgi:lysophospholipase